MSNQSLSHDLNAATPMSMSDQKWKQFLTEIDLRWPLLDIKNSGVKTPNQVAALLCGVAGLSQSRTGRELREMICVTLSIQSRWPLHLLISLLDWTQHKTDGMLPL